LKLKGTPLLKNNLGVMYDNEDGVPQGEVAAHMWFNLAASPGSAKRLKIGIFEQGQNLAREWKPTSDPAPP
jgi:TPR repeat protein